MNLRAHLNPQQIPLTNSKQGQSPTGIAFDGVNLCVTNFYGKSVTRLPPTDGVLVDRIAVGGIAAQRSSSAPARRQLLKRLAIVLYPTCDMPTLRVMVRPMDDPAFFVPDILAAKADAVAYLKSVDSRGDVDVVCHQQCLSRRKLNDESLVLRPVQIVWQNANHRALAFDLYVACSTRERATDGAVVDERCRTPFNGRTRTGARDEDERKESNGRCDENGLRTWPKGDVLGDRCTHPFPLRICCIHFSTLDSRVLDCLGAEK